MGAPDCPDCGSSDTRNQVFGRKEYKCENDDCDTIEFGSDMGPL
jgi:hypothetical protein